MTTAATSLLGLALPVTGELSGTWGDTVNNSITSLLDTAVAGTTTLSTDGDVTLSTTTLAANQARQAILLCSGARTALRTITAPAQSKIYTIINATTGGYAVKIVGVGPTTGISIPAGQTATVAWNGSDFVDASNYTNGNKVINGNLSVTGSVTLSGGTANGVAYLNGSKVVTTGSALTFDGTTLVSSRGASTGVAAQFGRSSGQSLYVYVDTASVYLGSDNGANTAWQLNETNDYIAGWLGGSEKMRLTSTGLGIGTSSPSSKLHVYNGSGTNATLIVKAENQYANQTASFQNISTVRTWDIGQNLSDSSTGALEFYDRTGAATRMRLDSSGNLGLGVTPSAWGSSKAIQLGSAASIFAVGSNSYIGANSYYNGTDNKYISNGYATLYSQQSDGAHKFYTAASGTAGTTATFTQAMTLDASGNLGIGTTSPGRPLDVIRGTAGFVSKMGYSSGVSIYQYTDANAAYISTATNLYNAFGINETSSYLNFYTANAERMRIDSSGNLGLGVTPSADWGSSGYKAFVVRTSFLAGSTAPGVMALGNNAYNDGAGWKYVATGVASYYYQNAGAHAWSYAASGTAGSAISFTQAMTLDASGNLALGGTANKVTGLSGSGSGFTVQAAAAPTIGFWDTSDNSYYSNAGQINDQFYLYNFSTTGGLVFGTNNLERARIDSSGNLLVGTTSATASALGGGRLVSTSDGTNFAGTFYQSSTSSSVYTMRVRHDNTTSGAYIQFVTDSNVETGRIYDSAGTMQYASSSDARLKTNVQPMQNSLQSVLALNPCTFDMRRGEDTFIPSAGLIAQEVHEVYPYVVGVGGDDENTNPWSVDYGKLTPLLVAAIKEQQALITQLTERITILESK